MTASNYVLVVLSEGATWEGYTVQEYGEPDAFGHRRKASVGEALATEISRRTGEESMVSDLTYDLRSGEPDFVDKLIAATFGNLALDAVLAGKTGVMTALAATRWRPFPIRPSARAKWMSPPCITPIATGPTTAASLACRSS